MLRLAAPPSWAPRPWRPSLGLTTTNFAIVVTDSGGTPVEGATVVAGEQTAYTDSSGIARFSVAGSRTLNVSARFGEYSVAKTVQWESADIPAYVSFPVRIQPALVKTAELAAFAAGVGLIGAGYVWKLDPLKIVGELVTGAIVFALIYRLAGR